MTGLLPAFFMWLASIALLLSISFIWLSLRALLGGDTMHWVEQSKAAQRRSEWLEEKDAVLRSLKDLEFEREVGKLSTEDYERLHGQFRARAKQIMQKLDDDLKGHREEARLLLRKVAAAEPEKAP